MSAAVIHVARYPGPSAVRGSGIFLAASSSANGPAPFFRGFLEAPRRGADLSLALAHVVETRFYTPPGMVSRQIAQRDPVITFGGGVLRLEGFSVCCGAYARLDLLPGAFHTDRAEMGTSNVDFNPPMRAALARLRDGERTQLEVSAAGFSLGEHFERRVELPERWLRSFVEAQAHQARMELRYSSLGVAAQRFLRALPRQATRGPVWVDKTLRISQSATPGAVAVGGVERLRVLTEVARHAVAIHLYSAGDGTTAWRLDTPDSRFYLVLSAEPARGFSGEGQVLHALAEGSSVTARVRALLRWQTDLSPSALAEQLRVDAAQVSSALAELGTSGLVGYDLAAGAYFHRELPFDVSRVAATHPRLSAAREAVVESDGNGGYWVRGRGDEYHVRRDEVGQWRCSCPWSGRYGESRGPCKHVLAVRQA